MRRVYLSWCALVFLVDRAHRRVRCGKLLDVRSGRMLSDQIISFDANGLITGIIQREPARPGNDGAIIDLSNATCLPGLIDVRTAIPVVWGGGCFCTW